MREIHPTKLVVAGQQRKNPGATRDIANIMMITSRLDTIHRVEDSGKTQRVYEGSE